MGSRARIATAVAIVGLCGFAAARGLSIVRFSHAKAGMASHEHHADAARPWVAVTGLAGAALEMSLADAVDPSDIDATRRRGDELAALLSVRPASSTHWLSLASVRFVAGEPLDKVLGALALSSATGANEGQLKSQRGIFGLWQWEILPPAVRKRTAADLAGAIVEHTMSEHAWSAAARLLAATSPDTRREIAHLLRAEGLSADDLKRIGL